MGGDVMESAEPLHVVRGVTLVAVPVVHFGRLATLGASLADDLAALEVDVRLAPGDVTLSGLASERVRSTPGAHVFGVMLGAIGLTPGVLRAARRAHPP